MIRFIAIFMLVLLCSGQPLKAFEPPQMYPADRLIVTVFTDMWQDAPGDMDLKTIQRGITISSLQDMPVGRTNFSVAAGLEFSSHNIYSDNRYLFNPFTDAYDFYKIASDYDNNKLSLNYLGIPVQFRFRTRNMSKTFRAYAGMKADYLISAHTKYVGKTYPDPHNPGEFPVAGRTIKVKEYKLDNISKYRIGLTGMIGYRSINLYLYYPLTGIFTDNSAENMTPVSVGVSFIVF